MTTICAHCGRSVAQDLIAPSSSSQQTAPDIASSKIDTLDKARQLLSHVRRPRNSSISHSTHHHAEPLLLPDTGNDSISTASTAAVDRKGCIAAQIIMAVVQGDTTFIVNTFTQLVDAADIALGRPSGTGFPATQSDEDVYALFELLRDALHEYVVAVANKNKNSASSLFESDCLRTSCEHVSMTLPVLCIAFVKGSESMDNVDTRLLEIMVSALADAYPLLTYPIHDFFPLVRQLLPHAPGSFLLHHRAGALTEDVMRTFLGVEKKAPPPAAAEGKKKGKKKHSTEAARNASSTDNADSSATSPNHKKKELNGEATKAEDSSAAWKKTMIKCMISVTLEVPLRRLVQQQFNTCEKFRKLVRDDDAMAAAVTESYGTALVSDLSAFAFEACCSHRTVEFIVQLVGHGLKMRCSENNSACIVSITTDDSSSSSSLFPLLCQQSQEELGKMLCVMLEATPTTASDMELCLRMNPYEVVAQLLAVAWLVGALSARRLEMSGGRDLLATSLQKTVAEAAGVALRACTVLPKKIIVVPPPQPQQQTTTVAKNDSKKKKKDQPHQTAKPPAPSSASGLGEAEAQLLLQCVKMVLCRTIRVCVNASCLFCRGGDEDSSSKDQHLLVGIAAFLSEHSEPVLDLLVSPFHRQLPHPEQQQQQQPQPSEGANEDDGKEKQKQRQQSKNKGKKGSEGGNSDNTCPPHHIKAAAAVDHHSHHSHNHNHSSSEHHSTPAISLSLLCAAQLWTLVASATSSSSSQQLRHQVWESLLSKFMLAVTKWVQSSPSVFSSIRREALDALDVWMATMLRHSNATDNDNNNNSNRDESSQVSISHVNAVCNRTCSIVCFLVSQRYERACAVISEALCSSSSAEQQPSPSSSSGNEARIDIANDLFKAAIRAVSADTTLVAAAAAAAVEDGEEKAADDTVPAAAATVSKPRCCSAIQLVGLTSSVTLIEQHLESATWIDFYLDATNNKYFCTFPAVVQDHLRAMAVAVAEIRQAHAEKADAERQAAIQRKIRDTRRRIQFDERERLRQLLEKEALSAERRRHEASEQALRREAETRMHKREEEAKDAELKAQQLVQDQAVKLQAMERVKYEESQRSKQESMRIAAERNQKLRELTLFLTDDLGIPEARAQKILTGLRMKCLRVTARQVVEFIVTGKLDVPKDLNIAMLSQREPEHITAFDVFLKDDATDFWASAATDKSNPSASLDGGGAAATAAATSSSPSPQQYSYHRRVALMLDLFPREAPFEPLKIADIRALPDLAETAKSLGWSDDQDPLWNMQEKGLVVIHRSTTVTQTALGKFYHDPYRLARGSLSARLDAYNEEIRSKLHRALNEKLEQRRMAERERVVRAQQRSMFTDDDAFEGDDDGDEECSDDAVNEEDEEDEDENEDGR